MRIDGRWLQFDDGWLRPVIDVEVLSADQFWVTTQFLIDTGADLTVLTAAVCKSLRLTGEPPQHPVSGVGGAAESVECQSQLLLVAIDGSTAVFNGPIRAMVADDALDTPILGNDELHDFAVIIDRPGNIVCLLDAPHRYEIVDA